MKKLAVLLLMGTMVIASLTGCGKKKKPEAAIDVVSTKDTDMK